MNLNAESSNYSTTMLFLPIYEMDSSKFDPNRIRNGCSLVAKATQAMAAPPSPHGASCVITDVRFTINERGVDNVIEQKKSKIASEKDAEA